MKSMNLLRALGGVDDKYIEETQGIPVAKAVSKRVNILRFAPVAVCLAVALIAVSVFLPQWGQDAPGETDIIITSGDPQSGHSVGTLVADPSDPNSVARPLYPLTFNTSDSMRRADRSWAFGVFDYDLTDEQLDTVFPNFHAMNPDIMLAANAFYGKDGTLLSVTAVETLTPGRMDTPALYSYYTRTEIQLGQGEIIEDCVVLYEDTPQVSEVYGVFVTAYMIEFDSADGVVFFQAEFTVDNIAYRVKMYDNREDGQKRMTQMVNTLIGNGPADLAVLADPVIPEMRYDRLTLDEARLDPDFGTFLPQGIPAGFTFESAYRVITTRENSLSAHWSNGYSNLEFRAAHVTDYHRGLIVSSGDRDKYDMSLYSIPLFDSVPSELREVVNNPVFLAEELTLDMVQARAFWVDERGDVSGWRMNFGVLYGDAVLTVSGRGVSPEQVWELLSELK